MTTEPEYIDAAEVAKILAIPRNTMYTYADRGIGPKSFKIGKHRRWERSEVLAWIEEQKAASR